MKKVIAVLALVLAAVALGGILIFRVRSGPLNVPVEESVRLYVYDGQTMQDQFLYEKDDLDRLADALNALSKECREIILMYFCWRKLDEQAI